MLLNYNTLFNALTTIPFVVWEIRTIYYLPSLPHKGVQAYAYVGKKIGKFIVYAFYDEQKKLHKKILPYSLVEPALLQSTNQFLISYLPDKPSINCPLGKEQDARRNAYKELFWLVVLGVLFTVWDF